MRIGIDARAASHPQRGGFKTYTEGLIRALAELDNQNEYLLYFDRPHHLGFNPPPNFSTRVVPGQPRLIGAGWREQRILPRWMQRDCVEIAHFPCNTASLRQLPGLVITLHDVIAFTSPQIPRFVSPATLWQWLIWMYARVVVPETAREARAVITVSEYEKKQIVAQLGVHPERVFVTHLAVNPVMRPLLNSELTVAKEQLAARFGIREPYILGIGFEPRKNMIRVIQAFQMLVAGHSKRISLALVVAHEATRMRLRTYVSEKGLDSRVILIGGVDQKDLVHLYNVAEVLVFPSLRESFGLPPLEAMACGTPVITSNRSSLPEVVGDAALCVNPTDATQIAGALQQVLEDSALAIELRERGLRRARQFSWERTAKQTLEVYQCVLQSIS